MRLAELDAEGFPKFLGRINAHDRLEFNLFPQLGRRPRPEGRCIGWGHLLSFTRLLNWRAPENP
jgi:hypothetical protein